MAHILLTTSGSLGDLHPMISLGRALREEDHSVLLATHYPYRENVEEAGLEFHPVGPEIDPTDPGLIERIADPWDGPRYLMEEVVMPNLRQAYRDFRPVCNEADLIVSGVISFHGKLAALDAGIPWVSTVLSPISFWSSYDPPVFAAMPWLRSIPLLGNFLTNAAMKIGKYRSETWLEEYYNFCEELEIEEPGNPLFEGHNSPYLVLAMFSRVFAGPQPDWPGEVVQTGFAFYDKPDTFPRKQEILQFMEQGRPPLLFTLGSAFAHTGQAASFYETCFEFVKQKERRALFVVGSEQYKKLGDRETSLIRVTDYAPYSEVFPEADIILHQGGVGTTGQALRAGRPMVVFPHGMDQFDNAYRIERSGYGYAIPFSSFSQKRLGNALERISKSQAMEDEVMEAGRTIRNEAGSRQAARVIEETFDDV